MTRICLFPLLLSLLLAASLESAEINLRWTDNSSNESGFRVERSTDGSSFSYLAAVGANVTHFKDGSVTASKKYWYRVCAHNSYGRSAYTAPVSAVASSTSTTTSTTSSTILVQGFKGSYVVGESDSFSATVDGVSTSSIESIELFENGTLLMRERIASYDFTYTPKSTGSKQLTLVATTTSGTFKKTLTANVTSTSSTTTAPRIVLNGFNGSYVVGESDNFSATVDGVSTSSIENIELFENGALVMRERIAPYDFTYSPTSAGSKQITLVASLTSGTVKKSITVEVASTTTTTSTSTSTRPEITVSGFKGSYAVGESDDFSVTVSGISTSSIDNIELFEDGTAIMRERISPYDFTYTPVSDGTKQLTLVVSSQSGTFKKTLSASVTSPSTSQIHVSGFKGSYLVGESDNFSVTVDGVSTSTISSIDLFEDGIAIMRERLAPYDFTYTPISSGKKQLTLIVSTQNGTLQKTLAAEVASESSPQISVSGFKGTYKVGEKDNFSVTVSGLSTSSIDSIVLFEDGIEVMTERYAPYDFSYKPTSSGRKQIAIIVSTKSGGTLLKTLIAEVSE